MLFKIIVGVLLFFIVIIVVAIIIYNNSKSSKLTNQHIENIIQFNGGITQLDTIINYCIQSYEHVSLVVVHHHHPIKIKNYILGHSRHQRFTSAFYIWILKGHTIFINKNIYSVDELRTFELEKGFTKLTKISVSDIYFPNIRRTFYIATLKFSESYFKPSTYDNVASVFEFLNKEQCEANPILVADFASQNWNFLNRDWKYSSGNYNIVTYVDDRGCVGRHGFLFNKLSGTIHVEQIKDLNIDCNLLVRLVLENDELSGSIKLDIETEKTSMSNKYRDSVNITQIKITPDKHNISTCEFVEYTHHNNFKIVPIEDILNQIIRK